MDIVSCFRARRPQPFVIALCMTLTAVLLISLAVRADAPMRTLTGVIALYTFDEGEGATIHDRAVTDVPLDLQVDNKDAITWGAGFLKITGETRIRAGKKSRRLYRDTTWTGALSIEAWILPATVDQKGPARIVSYSKNGSERNFTLGQDGNRYDVRFRTSENSRNGTPSLSSPENTLVTELTHVVYTRTRSGQATLYINGQAMSRETIYGDLSAWQDGYGLVIGNELSDDRPWLGEYHLVALYNRALLPEEVEAHYGAGPEAATPRVREDSPDSESAALFESHVAGILAKHCVECHNPHKHKGGLDLSNKTGALEAEDVIVPGNPYESLLWTSVVADEMPHERDPLPISAKETIRQWIVSGAAWTRNTIDPAVYASNVDSDSPYLRRLTMAEYVNTVRDTLGVDIIDLATKLLPPELRADGFSNTAYNLHVDLEHIDAYAQLAEQVAHSADVSAIADRISDSRDVTERNLERAVRRLGQWLLRAPLEAKEVASYEALARAVVAADGTYEEVVRYLIQGMLQSPRFLYQIENQRGDANVWPVDSFELASRLSYTLWGAPPDGQLQKKAREGDLRNPAVLEAEIDRMLLDSRAVAHSRRFAYEWLDLGRLQHLRPNTEHFPNWNPELARDMGEETLAFFEEVVWKEQRPLSDLFNAQFTFLSPALARHYGLTPRADGFQRYDLSDVSERGGLLTQGSLLTIGGDDASMVTRGLFVLNDILRGKVNNPPPDVDTTPIPPSPGKPQRAIAEERMANGACSGCHSVFEPLAFGLEKYDGIGRYSDTDGLGNTLREDGTVLVPGAAEPVVYDTVAQLMDVLAGSGRVQETLAWKLTQFALGRPLGPADAPVIERIIDTGKRGGGTYPSLMKAIVLSDLVQRTPTEAPS